MVRAAACARLLGFALAGASLVAPGAAPAADAESHMHHHMAVPDTKRTLHDYRVPAVRLVRDDGTPVVLRDELDDGRPVVLAFIYTSCTTICPVTSQTLAELQAKLGAARERVHLVSISIDPEQDTPARLRAYAKKFGAGPQWQHYTGTLAASREAQIAFDVYRGNKMDHAPVVLVRGSAAGQWVRIDGFPTSDQLLAELPALHAAR